MAWTCPPDRLERAAALVERMFRQPEGPEVDAILAALYHMRRMTLGREAEFADAKAGEADVMSWLAELEAYPVDVAISVVQDWPKNSKFWPTWHDLQQQLETAMSQRRIMRHVVNQLRRDGPKQIAAAPESDEHRAGVVQDCLARLAEGMLGPFDATRARADTVSGRRPEAGTDHAERLKAQATLEQIQNDPPQLAFSSPELLKRYGGKPEPTERPWTTEEN